MHLIFKNLFNLSNSPSQGITGSSQGKKPDRFSLNEDTVLSEITEDYLWNLLKMEVTEFGAMDTPRISLGRVASIAVQIDRF
jgi:hypothetical protein